MTFPFSPFIYMGCGGCWALAGVALGQDRWIAAIALAVVALFLSWLGAKRHHTELDEVR